jgi:RNA polymerase sigma-70 factor (ECF subfamily)
MPVRAIPGPAPERTPNDLELVGRIRAGERAAFEPLMRRYNQRLFRTARSIVRNAEEAEDVVPQTYLSAFSKLEQFSHGSSFATWLTRIAINEALARQRALRQRSELVALRDQPGWWRGQPDAAVENPEIHITKRELCQVVERAIDELPEGLRVALVLREVEGLSVTETADCLLLSEEATRVRVHRARRILQDRLQASLPEVFAFAGERCDRIVAFVLAQLLSESNFYAR